MHEFSFCRGIVDGVLGEYLPYQGKNTRVTRVVVVIGRLHQVLEDTLQLAYSLLTKDTPAAGSKLEIRFVDIEYNCHACSGRGTINPPLFLCADCGSGNIEIIKGKELYLEKLEISDDEQGN